MRDGAEYSCVGPFAAILLASVLIACRSLADADSALTSWWDQKTATGTWGGVRDELEAGGVTFSSSYTADFAGNVTGGRRRGFGYAGVWEAGVALDLEKLVGLPGTSLAASGFWASGRNVSSVYIDNFFEVQQIFAPGDFYLGQLSLSQSLLDDTVTLQAGRLFAGDVFATSPVWDYYVSDAVNDNPASIARNIFFPEFQVTAWGGRAFYQPTKELGFIAGVYDANPNVGNPGTHGTDFSVGGSDGALTIAQMTYQRAQHRDGGDLPGSATVGGYYESSRFAHLDNPAQQSRGSYGMYLYFDQMLFRGHWPDYLGPQHLRAGASDAARATQPHVNQSATPKDRPAGLTAWGALYVAPQQSIAPQLLQVGGGLLWHGLVPSRDRDVTAIAVISGVFSNHLAPQGAETVIEANYRVQLTPWLYVTPDFQYVIHPNGFATIGNAAVFAGEVSIAF